MSAGAGNPRCGALSGADFGVGRLRHLPGLFILGRLGRILCSISRPDLWLGTRIRARPGDHGRVIPRLLARLDVGVTDGFVRCGCHAIASTQTGSEDPGVNKREEAA